VEEGSDAGSGIHVAATDRDLAADTGQQRAQDDPGAQHQAAPPWSTTRVGSSGSSPTRISAEPSPATSLSIWEITYLLGRITVDQVMTRDVLTVSPTAPLEVAAQIMVDRKIGGLPVVEADLVLGVITETDIFRVFALILGANERGTGVTVTAIDRPGSLADLTGATALAGGDITAIVTYPADGGSKTSIFLKVRGISMERLTAAIRPHVERIDDMREARGGSSAGAIT
jgi:acetoin utilization protein AcuB